MTRPGLTRSCGHHNSGERRGGGGLARRTGLWGQQRAAGTADCERDVVQRDVPGETTAADSFEHDLKINKNFGVDWKLLGELERWDRTSSLGSSFTRTIEV